MSDALEGLSADDTSTLLEFVAQQRVLKERRAERRTKKGTGEVKRRVVVTLKREEVIWCRTNLEFFDCETLPELLRTMAFEGIQSRLGMTPMEFHVACKKAEIAETEASLETVAAEQETADAV